MTVRLYTSNSDTPPIFEALPHPDPKGNSSLPIGLLQRGHPLGTGWCGWLKAHGVKFTGIITDSQDIYSKEFWVKTFIGYLFVFIPFGLIIIQLNLAGVVLVNVNGEEYYGPWTVLFIVLYIPFASFLFAVMNWAFVMAGYSIYQFLKNITG